MPDESLQAMPASDLTGKVALITGASRGIGRATAIRFARAGAAVALAARDTVAFDLAVDEIQASGGDALACPCDVADEDSVIELFRRVSDSLGPVDILVNSSSGVMSGFRCGAATRSISVSTAPGLTATTRI